MKRIRRNIKGALLLLMSLFLLLVVYFCYVLFFYGDRWFSNVYNSRVSIGREHMEIVPGDILDRNKVILATTKSELRVDPKTGEQREYYFRSYHPSAKDIDISHVVGYHDSKFGRSGAEAFYVRYLMGYNNSLLEKIYQKAFLPQERGNDVYLTIDYELQKFISKELKNRKGSVVVLNPKTGEILAMVSKPSFDPNNVGKTAKEDNLINRATQGLYPPGSIFKIITAAAALENIDDVEEQLFECTGFTQIEEIRVPCYEGNAHGVVDIKNAMAVSCNGFFAHLGKNLGWKKMLKIGEKFGFNYDFLFSDIRLLPSQLPLNSRIGKEELVWDALGQGKVLVTPLHMAMVAATIANNGVMMEPKLLYKVVGRNEHIQKSLKPRAFKSVLSAENARLIQAMMELTVTEGTGKNASIKGMKIAGKTGTAEIKGTKESKINPHAWFIGFTSDNPTLAIAVIVENGGTGGAVAAPLAKKIIQKSREMGY